MQPCCLQPHPELQDLLNYNKNAMAIAKKFFNIPDIDDYYKKNDAKPLIFCHFARGLAEKVYNEVSDYQILYKTLMEVGVIKERSLNQLRKTRFAPALPS